MNSHESGKLIDEARLLMPWYLTNKLSPEEQKLVNEALEQSFELRAEFLQEEKMMRLVKENKNLLELTALDTTEQRLDKLLSRIQQQASHGTTTPKEKVESTSWLNKLFRSSLLGVEWLSPANAAFAGLLVCQVGILGYTQLSSSSSEETIYQPASVEKPSAGQARIGKSKALFLMEFQGDASYGAVCDFLNTWNARVVSGPNNQNMFSVELNTDATTDIAVLADNIMQQAVDNNAPLSFIGPQYQK
uniref:Uncharacterized protein n=1 Tax=uncultured Thiotrichaceae bacterium TaxID=298394 RepID=A0A6S6S411_9GAMM|nr:MAG: Unknown protein [uncultured Thiotrichaceae bacterium]